tara:strand:- start:703 stop:1635 length:933 start_codon:yes stop_codon:yes gene_type:complete
MTENVVVTEPVLHLYDDLSSKLSEIKSQRDALYFAHNDLKIVNDRYNIIIIVLSLFTAFFDTVKAQLNLTERKDFIAPIAIIAPIFFSTVVAMISSLLKFKKIPEKMEELIKAGEKCNFTILNMRQLMENLNFQDKEKSLSVYNGEVMGFYRDALEAIEKSMYPGLRQKYFKMAHESIVSISEDEAKYHQSLLGTIKKKRVITDELKTASGSKEHVNKFKDPEGVALKVINKILKEKNIDTKKADSFKDKLVRGKSFWNSEGKKWGDDTSESDDSNSPVAEEEEQEQEQENDEEGDEDNVKITFGDIDNV